MGSRVLSRGGEKLRKEIYNHTRGDGKKYFIICTRLAVVLYI